MKARLPRHAVVRVIWAAAFVLAVVVAAAGPAPAGAGEWSTSVTLTFGGAAIIGGAYMMWKVSVTKRVAKEKEGEGGFAGAELIEGDDRAYVRGSGDEAGISPDVHVNLVSIRF